MHITLTREFLQSRSREGVQCDLVVKNIIDQVWQQASLGKTRHVYITNAVRNQHDPNWHANVMAVLRRRLLDVSVEYKENERLDGFKETAIVIDWS